MAKNPEIDLYFYHPDHLGSSSWITDSGGHAIQHLQYLPFGETRVDQRTTSWSSRYSFSAKEKDEESGYGYFGARYYDSDLSIWLSVDPMAGKYPGLSPYNYCANNPIKLVDPNGMEVYINGDEAGIAFQSLQQGTNLTLERDEKTGKVTVIGGKVMNDNDKQLSDAISSDKVTANIDASMYNGENKAGGAYMGTEYDAKTRTASSTNAVNMTYLTNTENNAKAQTGSGMMHEITEGYQSGLISIDKKTSIKKAECTIEYAFTKPDGTRMGVSVPLYPADYELYKTACDRATPAPCNANRKVCSTKVYKAATSSYLTCAITVALFNLILFA